MKDGNLIHPTAIVGSAVQMGTNNIIGPYVVIENQVSIGNGNNIDAFASIGAEAEFKGKRSGGAVVIGSGNHIGEHVTIHQSLEPETATVIKNKTYIMTKVHVGHDAIIEDEATLSSCSIVGGHSVVQYAANIGLGAVIHQKRIVGKCSMIGMNSTVTKSIPPYVVAWGSPCKPYRPNVVGMQRRGLDPKFIEAVGYWLVMEQTGAEYNCELSHLVAEQVADWNKSVKEMGGK